MHNLLVLFSLILCSYWFGSALGRGDSDFGLVAQLRNDANLDLSVDEEYEDLRAELLAYHTALASISSRRSLLSTPCWNLGGICVNYKLCAGAKSLTEVPGCKSKHNVCCFSWNRYNIRDMRDKGINSLGLPWSIHREFGGKGIQNEDEKANESTEEEPVSHSKLSKKNKVNGPLNDINRPLALIIAGKSDK